MGIDIYKIKEIGNLTKIDSEIFDKLYPRFEVETTEISLGKEDLLDLIKQEKNSDHKEVFEQMLKEMGDEDGGDFIIG